MAVNDFTGSIFTWRVHSDRFGGFRALLQNFKMWMEIFHVLFGEFFRALISR